MSQLKGFLVLFEKLGVVVKMVELLDDTRVQVLFTSLGPRILPSG